MPIYEYICEDCGTEFDSLRTMQDADRPITCKKCEGTHTRRVISVFYAQSSGRNITGSSTSGCSHCNGGSCASCRN